MSLDALRAIAAEKADVPDNGLVRVRCAEIVAAVDALPVEALDRKAKDVRSGPATIMREQATEERRDECTCWVPLLSIRHVLKLAGG